MATNWPVRGATFSWLTQLHISNYFSVAATTSRVMVSWDGESSTAIIKLDVPAAIRILYANPSSSSSHNSSSLFPSTFLYDRSVHDETTPPAFDQSILETRSPTRSAVSRKLKRFGRRSQRLEQRLESSFS